MQANGVVRKQKQELMKIQKQNTTTSGEVTMAVNN